MFKVWMWLGDLSMKESRPNVFGYVCGLSEWWYEMVKFVSTSVASREVNLFAVN